ncbi:multicopper oxidase family protein [Pseudofrankia sp. BMG5.37]|uniref:multicopper oxidase family protein n=1 Tax=Pseudofrankia sp. BMG5.37 TaxID=3050035 RepID=UPI0008D8ED1F|nr:MULTISPECIES: multicopper oxidase domain-containing protein [unclassified Pseudofrankia]MDT3444774.1 multicopper oxidase domain-containing protein [Pseudofrankia sp. BMG5.37]OHV50508.1 copper oxidase [Pseudofrankia sp. BMG5.36]
MNRRHVLGAFGLSALGVVSFGGLALSDPRGQTGELLRSRARLPKPHTVPLPVPPVARPVRTDPTTDFYEIVQREADLELLPGLRTRVFGYDGLFPGPTLISRSGRPTVVTHHNQLAVPVAVHLHGGHTPADSDGHPTDLILPTAGWSDQTHATHGGAVTAGQRDYTYPMRQRAATLWYHDHRMDSTAAQVYRGLAGFHLVTDDEEAALPLPRGDRDIPLMITDRAFDADGSFRYPTPDHALHTTGGVTDTYMEGVLGDVILVNGAPWPVLEVAAARYRLRLLNASNARRYQLRLAPARTPFIQIGSDGGLLDHPVEQTTILLAPGERADVVVDFAAFPPGTAVTMNNTLGAGSTAQIMLFRVTGRASDDSHVPARLSHVEPLRRSQAVRTRDWRFRRAPTGEHPSWLINDRPFDPARIDADVTLGDVEIWRFTSDLHHPVHAHLNPFQVLSRRGGAPGPYDLGWKDTVDVSPSETVEVLVRFTDYAGRYLLHCHNLEHEDMAMMAAFRTR